MNPIPKPRMEKFYEPKLQGPRMLTSFQIDKELWNDFKMLVLRESRPAGNLLVELIEKYVKEHKDGNPQFTIDQFKDPNFVACPAFFRSLSSWDYYFKRQSPEELEKFKNQIIGIDKQLGKWI